MHTQHGAPLNHTIHPLHHFAPDPLKLNRADLSKPNTVCPTRQALNICQQLAKVCPLVYLSIRPSVCLSLCLPGWQNTAPHPQHPLKGNHPDPPIFTCERKLTHVASRIVVVFTPFSLCASTFFQLVSLLFLLFLSIFKNISLYCCWLSSPFSVSPVRYVFPTAPYACCMNKIDLFLNSPTKDTCSVFKVLRNLSHCIKFLSLSNNWFASFLFWKA